MKIFNSHNIQDNQISKRSQKRMAPQKQELRQEVGRTTNGQRIVKKAPPPKDEASIRARLAEKKAEIEAKNKPVQPEPKKVEENTKKEVTTKTEEKVAAEVDSKKVETKVADKKESKETKSDAVKETVAENDKAVNKVDGEVKKDIMLNSDIAKNDPKSPETTEKLKGILKAGGFSFNQKEKAALAKILGTAK